MANPKQPAKPRSTEEILREMEGMMEDSGATHASSASGKTRGGLKSLLDFFVKVVPEEEASASSPVLLAPNAPAGPAPPKTGPRLGDLVAGEQAPKFAASKTGADLSQRTFEDIYREAGISGSPCTIDELAALLENPSIANQPLNVKIIAVNLALSAKGINHEAPIADAVRRDRALDAYQSMLNDNAHTAEQRNLARIQQLTAETEEYLKRKQAEMEKLREEIAEAKRQAMDFSLRREVEEKRLANLISPFLEGKPNPVTVGNQPAGEEPAPRKQ
ncbi:MAG: hypothetical protein J2P41_10100 [Blastocatellia bacterium]|nr:hypothetical protein [Blastocatellia bacterium]